ncbi:MAG TPA: hypothetical protein VFX98_18780 [Longimicrobiaceae bacterium]|nr:hypothetical protein [Longimicrobiaceae bacterium]
MILRLALPLLLAAAPLAAQPSPRTYPLEKGDTVRVTTLASAPGRIVGEVAEVDSARIVLIRKPDYRRAEIPVAEVLDVSVYRGRNHLNGLLLGAGVGAAGGYAVTTFWLNAAYENDEWNEFYALLVGAPLGALVGGLAGGVAGLPRWVPVYPVRGGGVGVAVSVPVP